MIIQDEIDALASSRSSSDLGTGSHEGVLTSLLNEMDGVEELIGVTVVAATNRPDALVSKAVSIPYAVTKDMTAFQDSALMRPGRLDRILYIGPPDQSGREEILRIRTRSMSVEARLDIQELARIVSLTLLILTCRTSSLSTDRWLLRSRAQRIVPGGRVTDDEARPMRTICKAHFSFP